VRVACDLKSAELELVCLLAAPLSRREIGARLFVLLNTVKTHQRALYRKLWVGSRAKAVERAKALGLLRVSRRVQEALMQV
jgi:LuxR family transcriptional regulator, maltose regulon positive regulatory protein